MNTKLKDILYTEGVSKISSLSSILSSGTIYLPGKSSASFFGSLVNYNVAFESEFAYDAKTGMIRLHNMSVENAYKKRYSDFVTKFNMANLILKNMKNEKPLNHEFIIKSPQPSKYFRFFDVWMNGYKDPIITPDISGLYQIRRIFDGKCHICHWFKSFNKKFKPEEQYNRIDVQTMTRAGRLETVRYYNTHSEVIDDEEVIIPIVHSGGDHKHIRVTKTPYDDIINKHRIAIDEMLFRISTNSAAKFKVSNHLFDSITYKKMMNSLLASGDDEKIRILVLTYMYVRLGRVPAFLIDLYVKLSGDRNRKNKIFRKICECDQRILSDAYMITYLCLVVAGKVPDFKIDLDADHCYYHDYINGKTFKRRIVLDDKHLTGLIMASNFYRDITKRSKCCRSLRFITFLDLSNHKLLKKGKQLEAQDFDISKVRINDPSLFVSVKGANVVKYDPKRLKKEGLKVENEGRKLRKIGISKKTIEKVRTMKKGAKKGLKRGRGSGRRRRRYSERKKGKGEVKGKNVFAEGKVYQPRVVTAENYVSNEFLEMIKQQQKQMNLMMAMMKNNNKNDEKNVVTEVINEKIIEEKRDNDERKRKRKKKKKKENLMEEELEIVEKSKSSVTTLPVSGSKGKGKNKKFNIDMKRLTAEKKQDANEDLSNFAGIMTLESNKVKKELNNGFYQNRKKISNMQKRRFFGNEKDEWTEEDVDEDENDFGNDDPSYDY